MFLEIYSMQSSFAVRLLRSDELWIYDQIIYEYYLSLICTLLCMIKIALYFLRSIDLVWPTRLVFLAMGEVLCDGFNPAVSSPSDSRGSEARICIVAIKAKNMGFYPIDWIYPSTPCHLA